MGEKEVRMINLTSGSNTITDTTTPPAMPPVETYITGKGKITQLQTNREGMVNGLVVDNKTILRVPPPVAIQLNTIAQKNASIAYTGMKKASNRGEVSAADYTIVNCKTIMVNGQQYIVQ